MTEPVQVGAPIPESNPIANGIDTAISGGESFAEKAVDTAAEGSQTWLALPFIKQVFEAIVHYLLTVVSKTGQLAITFAVNRAQGNSENSDLADAEKEVEAALQTGDPNAISKAEQDFQAAQSSASNSDGFTHPQ